MHVYIAKHETQVPLNDVNVRDIMSWSGNAIISTVYQFNIIMHVCCLSSCISHHVILQYTTKSMKINSRSPPLLYTLDTTYTYTT